MAGTSSFTNPSYPTLWSDYRLTNILMLSDLADNDNNLINAKSIRNSVWTLWNKIEDVQITANQALIENTYVRNAKTTIAVGNAAIGSTFSGTIQDALDKILYAYAKQENSIHVEQGSKRANQIQLQYGSPLSLNLYWSVKKNSYNLNSITVNNISYTPLDLSIYWGVSQSGSQSALGTYSSSFTNDNLRISQTQIFTMSTFDGTTAINTTASVVWCNNVYWGRLTTQQVTVGNLVVSNKISQANITAASSSITNAMILGLDGAGSGTGKNLSLNYNATYNNVTGNGSFICFAWPQAFERTKMPSFTESTTAGNNYTKIKNMVLTNELGFGGITYSIWLSNAPRNTSPITISIS